MRRGGLPFAAGSCAAVFAAALALVTCSGASPTNPEVEQLPVVWKELPARPGYTGSYRVALFRAGDFDCVMVSRTGLYCERVER